MNAPVKIDTALRIFAASGWADAGTSTAHRLLDDLYRELDPDSDAASAVYLAMEAIEAADEAVKELDR